MRLNFKSIAAVLVLLSLLVCTRLTSAQQARTELPTVAPIRLFVTVTMPDGFVTGLPRERFEVIVDKQPARIVDFSNDDSPLSIGIVLDLSISMSRIVDKDSSETKLKLLQQSLRKFLEASNKSNDYFLMTFNVKRQLMTDWTSDTSLIIEKLNGMKTTGNTAFFDACHDAINELQKGRHRKRALLVISDGIDTDSKNSRSDVLKLLKETGILLYSIDFEERININVPYWSEGAGILWELAGISGGMAYTAKSIKTQRDTDEIFEEMAAELRHQYTIGIEPQNGDGKFHKVKVKLNIPADAAPELKKLIVRARPGFISPAPTRTN